MIILHQGTKIVYTLEKNSAETLFLECNNIERYIQRDNFVQRLARSVEERYEFQIVPDFLEKTKGLLVLE